MVEIQSCGYMPKIAASEKIMHRSADVTLPFLFLLIGGVLISVGGLVTLALSSVFSIVKALSSLGTTLSLPGGSLGGLAGGLLMVLTTVGVIGIVMGFVIVAAAFHSNRKGAHAWGILAVICALVSFVDGGGFVVGGILGIVGGAMATRIR